jgi:hypothetical protein
MNTIPPPDDTQPSSLDVPPETPKGFHMQVEKRFRLLEANMDLCLNYVRELAKTHLLPDQIQRLEDQHTVTLGSINSEIEPPGE